MKTSRFWNIIAIISIFFISVLSLVTMRSSDFYAGSQFHEAQTVWFIIGFIIFFVVSRIEIRFFHKFAIIYYFFVILLLAMTLFFGKVVNNARRWIELFGITIQASEAAKIAVIFITADFFNQQNRTESYTVRKMGKLLIYVGILSMLIFLEPDLGTTLLVVFVFCFMALYEGIRLKSFFKVVAFIIFLVPVMWHTGLIKEYQKDRVRLWVSSDSKKLKKMDKKLFDKYLQPKQALWSVGAGGVLGKGLLKGNMNRLKYLPALQTDFIFAIFSEEQGLVGCLFLLVLYFFVISWCFAVSLRGADKFRTHIAFGTGMMILLQLFMNIGMVIGILPVVGITLPLMSYGGSSILITLFSLGLVYNVALQT